MAKIKKPNVFLIVLGVLLILNSSFFFLQMPLLYEEANERGRINENAAETIRSKAAFKGRLGANLVAGGVICLFFGILRLRRGKQYVPVDTSKPEESGRESGQISK